ncbi:hypothetical protein T4C_6431 [Trichinella pseudospiralis]|uniref:Uncharacterized protein n=1 Tax=Trichinella pseudospiralis TaxID=6337 RepID=A0A0V1GCQ5_TRIPS|nr:hypothetical protein T4C_6431 [Trichinella pseudospiralis]
MNSENVWQRYHSPLNQTNKCTFTDNPSLGEDKL